MSSIDNSSVYNDNDNRSGSPELQDGDIIREQDRLLPIANVARIMKQAVPTNAKISKEAKETVQECVSEFISFISSEASERCQQEKRKTINGEDIIWAMEALGFDQYSQLMKIYLQRYKEITKSDKNSLGAAQLAYENAYHQTGMPIGFETMMPPAAQDPSAFTFPSNTPSN